MKKGYAKTYYAVCILFSVIFMSVYKLTAYRFFSGANSFVSDCTTPYGGIQTGELREFAQTGKETCGQASAAFFLASIGIPATEASLIEHSGTDSMLSLADIERIFLDNGFKTQALKIDPGYFRKYPAPAILRFTEEHFVVFIQEENGNPMLFDPAYGQVYLSWDRLAELFSGYMLYVYTS